MGGTGVVDRFLDVFTRYIDSGFGLLGGEVAAKGVLAPEACFAPGPFFEDLRREVNLFTERDGALVTEAFEFLD